MLVKAHSRLRFTLGLLKRPSLLYKGIRELVRVARAPDMDARVPMKHLVAVKLVPVESDKTLRDQLVEIYANNPSPYVSAPKTNDALSVNLARGVRYFLVVNDSGEFVGARAFDPGTKLLQSTVTIFRHRGQGYQVSAGRKLISMLADEGYTEVRGNVLRSNTRMLRAMKARGWSLSVDAENPELIRGVLKLNN